MDCNTQHLEFISSLEKSINHSTPAVRYVCETDRLLFAIPSLVRKVGMMKENRVYLCEKDGRCLTIGSTPEESVQHFRQFIDDLLSKKTRT